MASVVRLQDGDVARELDVLETKLSPPRAHAGIIPRPAQVRRLKASGRHPVVAMIAPAGYGKTTLGAMWAAEDERPFAWYLADDRDSDPAMLLRGLASAIDRVRPLEPAVVDAVARPGASIWTRALPRLGSAIARMDPFVLVVDDMDRIADAESVDAIVTLAAHVPERSQVVVIGRNPGTLPVARLMSRGQIFLLGQEDLALTQAEVAAVAQAIGVRISAAVVADMHARTEGWAAGVYLAVLSARRARAPHSLLRDGLLKDYVQTEVFDVLAPGDREFVLRSSVFERFSAPMLDAVLERTDSAEVLDRIRRTTLFLIPLDEDRTWYRYHRLMSEYLPGELDRREEGLQQTLLRRAAAWHERRGLDELALEYAMAAGDEDSAARLIVPLAQPVLNSGRAATLQRWFSFFDRDDVGRRQPRVAALGAIVFSLEGDSERADRWLATGRRATVPRGRAGDEITALLAQASVTLCQAGPTAMLRDAETAVALFPEDHQYRIASMAGLGIALVLDGQTDAADVALAAAIDEFDRRGRAGNGAVLAILYRAWLALARGDWTAAASLVVRGRRVAADAGLSDHVVGCALAAISARIAMHHGATEQARDGLAIAQRLRPLSGYAVPWLAIPLRLDLARVMIALDDVAGARTMLDEIDDVLAHRGDVGSLAAEIARVRARVAALPAEAAGASSLTVAELRLLPLLTTHLSFPEIGQRLYVSRNTVKTQAKSIYRKFDVDSRSGAVAAAVDRGLLEPIAAAAD